MRCWQSLRSFPVEATHQQAGEKGRHRVGWLILKSPPQSGATSAAERYTKRPSFLNGHCEESSDKAVELERDEGEAPAGMARFAHLAITKVQS